MGLSRPCRTIRIFFASETAVSDPVFQSLQMVLGHLFAMSVEATPEHADIIVAMKVTHFADFYNESQQFVVLLSHASLLPQERAMGGEKPNIHFVLASNVVGEICQIAAQIDVARANAHDTTNGGSFDAQIERAEREESFRPGIELLNVLVIDDDSRNREAALQQLAPHRVVIASGYNEAMEKLTHEKWDIVLTDLYLPMSPETLGPLSFRLGQLVPYGFLLMLEAAAQGTPHVGIVTDLNHHQNALSAAFDYFSRFAYHIEEARVRLIHAQTEDGVKRWDSALHELVADPTMILPSQHVCRCKGNVKI